MKPLCSKCLCRNADARRTQALIYYHSKRAATITPAIDNPHDPSVSPIGEIPPDAAQRDAMPIGEVAEPETPAVIAPQNAVSTQMIVPIRFPFDLPKLRELEGFLNDLFENTSSTTFNYSAMHEIPTSIWNGFLPGGIEQTINWEQWGTSIYDTRPVGLDVEIQSAVWRQDLQDACMVSIKAMLSLKEALTWFSKSRRRSPTTPSQTSLEKMRDDFIKIGHTLTDIRTREERGRKHLERCYRKKKLIFFDFSNVI